MKNKIIFVIIVIAILLGGDYLFIPNIVVLKSSTTINVTQDGLHRMLLNKKSVAKWWPGSIKNEVYYFNDIAYAINDNNISLLPIILKKDDLQINTSFYLITIDKEQVNIEWVGKTITSYNPIKRILAYVNAKKINADMDVVLNNIKKHYTASENIYGCSIKEALVVDANLINTFSSTKGYPTIEHIYTLIDKLTSYANNKKVAITGYPMLNVQPLTKDSFYIKVALPLEKVIPGNGEIFQKQMLKDGNILVTEVKGGILQTQNVFNEIVNYANDHHRSMPAIPFYSLITDRRKDTDSIKWITKIYCPVM
jgi:effector-binding domain-containing protein